MLNSEPRIANRRPQTADREKRDVNHRYACLYAAQYLEYMPYLPSGEEILTILYQAQHNTYYKLR